MGWRRGSGRPQRPKKKPQHTRQRRLSASLPQKSSSWLHPRWYTGTRSARSAPLHQRVFTLILNPRPKFQQLAAPQVVHRHQVCTLGTIALAG